MSSAVSSSRAYGRTNNHIHHFNFREEITSYYLEEKEEEEDSKHLFSTKTVLNSDEFTRISSSFSYLEEDYLPPAAPFTGSPTTEDKTIATPTVAAYHDVHTPHSMEESKMEAPMSLGATIGLGATVVDGKLTTENNLLRFLQEMARQVFLPASPSSSSSSSVDFANSPPLMSLIRCTCDPFLADVCVSSEWMATSKRASSGEILQQVLRLMLSSTTDSWNAPPLIIGSGTIEIIKVLQIECMNEGTTRSTTYWNEYPLLTLLADRAVASQEFGGSGESQNTIEKEKRSRFHNGASTLLDFSQEPVAAAIFGANRRQQAVEELLHHRATTLLALYVIYSQILNNREVSEEEHSLSSKTTLSSLLSQIENLDKLRSSVEKAKVLHLLLTTAMDTVLLSRTVTPTVPIEESVVTTSGAFDSVNMMFHCYLDEHKENSFFSALAQNNDEKDKCDAFSFCSPDDLSFHKESDQAWYQAGLVQAFGGNHRLTLPFLPPPLREGDEKEYIDEWTDEMKYTWIKTVSGNDECDDDEEQGGSPWFSIASRFTHFFSEEFFVRRCFDTLWSESQPDYTGFRSLCAHLFSHFNSDEKDVLSWFFLTPDNPSTSTVNVKNAVSFFRWLGLLKSEDELYLHQVVEMETFVRLLIEKEEQCAWANLSDLFSSWKSRERSKFLVQDEEKTQREALIQCCLLDRRQFVIQESNARGALTKRPDSVTSLLESICPNEEKFRREAKRKQILKRREEEREAVEEARKEEQKRKAAEDEKQRLADEAKRLVEEAEAARVWSRPPRIPGSRFDPAQQQERAPPEEVEDVEPDYFADLF